MAKTDRVLLEYRRAKYLEAAIRCRAEAARAVSSDGKQQLMLLAIMYQELAEYAILPEPAGTMLMNDKDCPAHAECRNWSFSSISSSTEGQPTFIQRSESMKYALLIYEDEALYGPDKSGPVIALWRNNGVDQSTRLPAPLASYSFGELGHTFP